MAKKKNTLNDLFDDPSPDVSPYAETNTPTTGTESTHTAPQGDIRTQGPVPNSERSQERTGGHAEAGADAAIRNVGTGRSHNDFSQTTPTPTRNDTGVDTNASATAPTNNTTEITGQEQEPPQTHHDKPQSVSMLPQPPRLTSVPAGTGMYGYQDSRLAKQQRNELRHRVRSAAGRYAAALQAADDAQYMWEQACAEALKAGCKSAMLKAAAEGAELPEDELPADIRR